MEHERLISEKIRLEELKPIHWEKERVWNGIQRDMKSTGYSTYFIAASVALACCLTYYFIFTNLDQNIVINNSKQESKIDLCNQEIQKTAIEESILSKENCDNGIMPSRQIAKWNETIPVSVPSIAITSMQDSINLSLTEDQALDSIHFSSLVQHLTEDSPKVEAIIGVIPVEQTQIRIVKEKKLRIKFSRDHYEFLQDDNPKKQVITARIN